MPFIATSKDGSGKQFVIFSLDREKYGVEISYVREIMKWTNMTQLPQMPKEMAGLIKLRDRTLPVMSLRNYFGLPESLDLENTKIVILEADDVLFGVSVDDVDQVARIPESAIDLPEKSLNITRFIQGIAKVDPDLLILIDVNALFNENLLAQITDHDNTGRYVSV